MFLLATGKAQGLEALVEAAKKLLGHQNIEGHIVTNTNLNCFRPGARVYRNQAEAEQAKDAFKKAGLKALQDKCEKWGNAKMESRVLGYGNLGGLTVFYYNMPTTTVTALWKDNSTEMSPWRALFRRRPRED